MPKKLDQELYNFIRERTVAIRFNDSAYDLPTWTNIKLKAKRVGDYEDIVIEASLVNLQKQGLIYNRFNEYKRKNEYYTRI